MKWIAAVISHSVVFLLGIALGMYLLPIFTAEPSPTAEALAKVQGSADYQAQFERQRSGSDWLHWGQGSLYLTPKTIAFRGELAPGPDYRLYLSPVFVEDEQQFLAHKAQMVAVGAVNSFNGFILPVSESLDISRYNTAIIWCESFNQFISSGRYQ